jgi:hypothetical protein
VTVLVVPERYPTTFSEDFANGIGNWTAGSPVVGGPRSVSNGVFSSHTWGYDNNHTTDKGGPGMLHLLAYADFPYWPDADFTNARVKLRARGVSFDPNGSEFIAEPRTALLQTGNWEDVEWQLTPDPSKWVWGKGENGSIYDTFLSLQESLQNIFNVHFLMLGPDNVGHPTGTFELDSCSILYNRKAPDPVGPRWGDKAAAVSLAGNNLFATHGPFTANGGVRGDTPLSGAVTWTGKHLSGDITKCFAFGICNANYSPSVHGGTFFADTVNGWGYLTDRGDKRHGGTADVNIGPAFSAGDTYMVRFVENYDANGGAVFFGRNGVLFNGPAYTGLPSGDYYPIESNGTANGSWVWRADFSGL